MFRPVPRKAVELRQVEPSTHQHTPTRYLCGAASRQPVREDTMRSRSVLFLRSLARSAEDTTGVLLGGGRDPLPLSAQWTCEPKSVAAAAEGRQRAICHGKIQEHSNESGRLGWTPRG